jgi:hypothetical protein
MLKELEKNVLQFAILLANKKNSFHIYCLESSFRIVGSTQLTHTPEKYEHGLRACEAI